MHWCWPVCVSVWGCQIPRDWSLQAVVNCRVGIGNWTWILWKSVGALNRWAISPPPLLKMLEHGSSETLNNFQSHTVASGGAWFVCLIMPHASCECQNENTLPQRSEKTNAGIAHSTKSEPPRAEGRTCLFPPPFCHRSSEHVGTLCTKSSGFHLSTKPWDLGVCWV